MSESEQQGTNPTPPRAPSNEPHPSVQPSQQPVQVQADLSGLSAHLSNLGQTLAGIPEQVVNAIRESTPQPSTTDSSQSTEQNGQSTQQQSTTEPSGRNKPSRFAKWWHGMS